MALHPAHARSTFRHALLVTAASLLCLTSAHSQAPGGDTRLSFYQRGYSVIVTVRGSTNPKLKDTLIQAARQMLPKLP